MNISEFKNSINNDSPPESLNKHLQALWWEAKDQWEKAHKIVQNLNDNNAAWIHAYLHRKEGDAGNAAYWYSKAGKPVSTDSLKEEWNSLVDAMITFYE